jgi:hypothetical protein
MRWLTAWDTGSPQPNAATLNDKAGLITSNSAVVPAGTNGSINIFTKDATNVVVDINGYYVPPGTLPLGNTAVGESALQNNTTGKNNTATGFSSLLSNTTGSWNTAVGIDALSQNSTGTDNTAVGTAALGTLGGLGAPAGLRNSAFGEFALGGLTAGNNNLGLGYKAGLILGTGSYNIFIANQGTASDTNLIRIGDSNQSQTFIAAIRGVTPGNADTVGVIIDANGQLGTPNSSRRVKRDIEDMGDTTSTILALHPVRFRYQVHGPDSPLQYGLIAEEVAEIAPELVARNKDGEIETVYYDKVNAMLLNHVQRLTREKDALADVVRDLESRLAALEDKAK